MDLQEGSQEDCKGVLEDVREKGLGLAAPLRGHEEHHFQWVEACLYRRNRTAAEDVRAHTQVVAVAARSQGVVGQVESREEEDRDSQHIAEIDLDEDDGDDGDAHGDDDQGAQDDIPLR